MRQVFASFVRAARRATGAPGGAGKERLASIVAHPPQRRHGELTLLFFTLGGMCLFGHLPAVHANSDPAVSNAHAEQRVGSQLVDITYDLDDADGDSLAISVKVSSDRGLTFTVRAWTLSGDVGWGVTPGKGKRIVWDAGMDRPGAYGPDYRVKVMADDGMVLLPAGEFLMGDAFSEGDSDELPQHRVYLDAFLIDRYEVTNTQYKAFCDATGRGYPPDPGWIYPDYFKSRSSYPVVNVYWDDANAYAEWAGKRLPTEAEWEKAARGGLEGKRYPWGDAIGPDDANIAGIAGQDRWACTSPVGSFAPNGYGLYDMTGNVWEWCKDRHGSNYYSSSPGSNPTGPDSGDPVFRGGAWDRGPNDVRVANRYVLSGRFFSVGFRCAKSLAP